jgi:ribosomal protein S18 acetylase RimI-like enzyme
LLFRHIEQDRIVELSWRSAELTDVPNMQAIADQIHVELPERPEVLAEKLRLFPQGVQVVCAGAQIVGYGVAHPWMLHQPPVLDAFLRALPDHAECLHIHDVAVLPDHRGRKAVASYVAAIANLARAMNIGRLALVSVYGTDPLWTRFGFRVVLPDAALGAKLRSYGATAKYMVCDVGAGGVS